MILISDELEYDIKPAKDDFQAYLTNGAFYTNTMGYPILESWMILDSIPKRMVPFDKIKEVNDLSDCIICMYCNDASLNKIRKNPHLYLKNFSKAMGITGLDFSIFNDQPYAIQIYQMYSNLAYSYYYGLRHIPIVPNVRIGETAFSKEYFDAIPKGAIVSIGTYGFSKTKEEKNRQNKFVEELVESLRFKTILVYGSLTTYAKHILCINNIRYYCYKPWISIKDKGMLYDWN